MASKLQLFLMAASALAAGPLSGVPLVLATEVDPGAVQPPALTPPAPVMPEPHPVPPAVTAAPQPWRPEAADQPPGGASGIDTSVDDILNERVSLPSERVRLRSNLITPQMSGPRERACLDGALSQSECGARVLVVGRSRRDGLSSDAAVVSRGVAAVVEGEGSLTPEGEGNANDTAPSEGQAQPEPAQHQPLVHAKQASRRHASPDGFSISGALVLPVLATAAVFPALGIVMELGILALPDQLRRLTDLQVAGRPMAARLPLLPLWGLQVRWAPLDLRLKVCRSVSVCSLGLALVMLHDSKDEARPTGLRVSGLPGVK